MTFYYVSALPILRFKRTFARNHPETTGSVISQLSTTRIFYGVPLYCCDERLVIGSFSVQECSLMVHRVILS